MREITFLERLAENLLEGGFARVLKTKLQPVQIAKALARAMERSEMVGPKGPLVANRYLVYVHPAELTDFSRFQATLESELASYLRGYAERRGLQLLLRPLVRLVPEELDARRGRVRVEASLADAEALKESASVAPRSPIEGTVEMQAAPRTTAPSLRRPPAALVDNAGRSYDVSGADVTIGRAIDNDIILEEIGASRHHARVFWHAGRYVLLDLDSTNGTLVSGQKVSRHILADGESLSFGGSVFTFRVATSEEGEPQL